jgi:hypothetical protein
MLRIACFCFVIASAAPLWSQVQPSASGGTYDLDSEHMMTPPPVSGAGYPTTAKSAEKTNFLSGGMVFTASYTDNLMLLGGNTSTPDETYAFLPTINFDRRTPRHEESLNYSTGFTMYQTYSELNSVTQNGTGSFKYNLTPYAVVAASDSFTQNYNTYNQGNPFTGGTVSGTGGPGAPGTSGPPLIEPYANQLSNSSNASVEYQYSKNAMVGASGSYYILQFSGTSYIAELSNQNTSGGNAFFSRRFGRSYAGLTYQFAKFVTHPYGSYTVSETVMGFYTHYFTPTFSISMLGGPEHYTSWTESNSTRTGAWTPAVQGSVGWQVARANLAGSYAHIVSGAGGLIGTFHSDTGALSGQIVLSRIWSTDANVGYSHFANTTSTPVQFSYFSGGDSLFGGINVQRRFTESLSMEAGYVHFHQSYPGVTTTSSSEDSDRGYVSIMYHFNRPLGR